MLVESEIKKWGNSLALRITGSMAEIPHFTDGCKVLVDITEEGLVIKPIRSNTLKFPFTEAELLEGLTPQTAHADEIANPLDDELGYE